MHSRGEPSSGGSALRLDPHQERSPLLLGRLRPGSAIVKQRAAQLRHPRLSFSSFSPSLPSHDLLPSSSRILALVATNRPPRPAGPRAGVPRPHAGGSAGVRSPPKEAQEDKRIDARGSSEKQGGGPLPIEGRMNRGGLKTNFSPPFRLPAAIFSLASHASSNPFSNPWRRLSHACL